MSEGLRLFSVFCIAVVIFSAGVAAYTGHYRGWAKRTAYVFNIGPALIPWGVMLFIYAVESFFYGSSEQMGILLDLLVIIPGALVPISVFWLPRCLLPSWYVRERDEADAIAKTRDSIYREARKIRKAEKKLAQDRRKNNRGF